jgi:hypothetical protein
MRMTTESLQNKQVSEVFPPEIASIIDRMCKQAFSGLKNHFEIQLGNDSFMEIEEIFAKEGVSVF